MVAVSFDHEKAINKRFIVHGPEGILFHEALRRYIEIFHPEIKNVTSMPYRLASIIATIKGQKQMKAISNWMKAFEKIGERGDPSETNKLLGAPTIRLDDWLMQKKKNNAYNHLMQ